MMKHILTALALLGFLSSCGADGAPKAPAPEPGISITGQAQIGVVGGS